MAQKFYLSAFEPYLRLSRVDRPAGTLLLFFPTAWGLALAGGELRDIILHLSQIAVGAFLMRGAGCTVNDMLDRDIDKKVKRTANRPLACGELNLFQALIWLFIQLLLAAGILISLNRPCFLVGVLDLGLVAIYPLAKRITSWPQAVLGLTFNQVFMGYAASAKFSQNGYLTFPWLEWSPFALYLAAITWTIVYDTMYAYQDYKDDKKVGVGSTAVFFGDNYRPWLRLLTLISIAGFVICGKAGGLGWPYYVAVGLSSLHLGWQIETLDIKCEENCQKRFKSNVIVGGVILLGLLASAFIK